MCYRRKEQRKDKCANGEWAQLLEIRENRSNLLTLITFHQHPQTANFSTKKSPRIMARGESSEYS